MDKITIFLKISISILAAIYFLYGAANVETWRFLDGVDLLIHEAGHMIFMPFGEFVSVAGGSILQSLVPLMFVIYFFAKGMPYSGSLVMLWLGQNFINISLYAGDAIEMRLPLLGGGTHDWNYLLTDIGLLSKTQLIGSFFYFLGILIIIIGGIAGIFFAIKQKKFMTQ